MVLNLLWKKLNIKLKNNSKNILKNSWKMYLSLIKNINSIDKKYIFISIFLLSVIVLCLPSGIYTGLTGKDEYYLSFRVVLEMLEREQWFVPFLDEAPRLRKPPLLYWLGYFWSELIGFSLFKLRLLSCILTGIFIITLLAIATEIFEIFKSSIKNTKLLLVAVLLLSNFVIITEGRRFMLDIPVNVFSALSFLCLLKAKIFTTEIFPRDFKKYFYISLSFILLSLGFLIKGPIVFIFCGTGIISLCLVNFGYFNNLKNFISNYKNIIFLLIIISISLLIMLAWFLVVKSQFPDEFSATLSSEISARNFFNVNIKPFVSIILIAFPFSIFGIYLIFLEIKKYIKTKKIFNSKVKFLLILLLLNLLPYCFIKSFERYLVASIFPLILLVAIYFPILIKNNICRRLSSIILVFIYSCFCLFIYYFQLNSAFSFIENFIIFTTLFLFIYYWWNNNKNNYNYIKKFAALLLLWNVILCILFPALNINFIPNNIIKLTENKYIIYYKGPQPAMLSIISKKANLHYDFLTTKNIKNIQNNTIIFVEKEHLQTFSENIQFINKLQNNKLKIHSLGSYQTLTTKGSGIKFVDFKNDKSAIIESIKNRNINKLQKTIYYFEISISK